MIIATIIVAVILAFTLLSLVTVSINGLHIDKGDTIIMKAEKIYMAIFLIICMSGIFLLLAYGIVYVFVDLSCEFNNNDMKICQEVINK